MAAPPRRLRSPPALPDELLEEILLRLPPDDPACLLRTSLVCKTWGGAVSSPGFRRRLQELHGAPPVLGFLHNWLDTPRFIPATSSSFSLAAPDIRSWEALDCRHGRALFWSPRAAQVLVWEPITGTQQRLPVPDGFRTTVLAGAVICAEEGCDHSDCHGGPFRVVVVLNYSMFFQFGPYHEETMSACMYSSETGTWGERTSAPVTPMQFNHCSSVLVGKSLLYFLSNEYVIIEYDLDAPNLALVDLPDFHGEYDGTRSITLILSEDGELGVAEVMMSHLYFWSWECDGDDALWITSKAIHLNKFLPISALAADSTHVTVFDYAEEANAIFVSTMSDIFTIELHSGRARKLCKHDTLHPLIPVVSFYTPVPRREHQDLLKLNPSEEGAEKDQKTVDQRQQLFDKGSSAIKQGDFVNALGCVDHALEIRLPCYGEVAQKCTSTVCKHGSASGSKVEDAAPPSEKGDCAV